MNALADYLRGLAIVLFASTGVCLAQSNDAPRSVELPISIRHGDLMVKVEVNGSEPLAFKLDTGFGITTIHPDLVEKLHLERNGRLTIIGIAGDEEAATYGGAKFDFKGMSYEPRRVAALGSENRRRSRYRDGILGAGFFRRFVVEMDVHHGRLRLHAPDHFEYKGQGEIIPLEFKKDTPIIEASIVPAGLPAIAGKFEIDSGCDDAVCLAQQFVETNHLLQTNGASSGVKRGVGGTAEVQHGNLTELRFGKLTVPKPSASFFREGSPAGEGQAGHIGLGALQRFKVIFDYSRKRMILESVP